MSMATTMLDNAAMKNFFGLLKSELRYLQMYYPRVMCIFWFTFAMAIAGVKVCMQESK